MRPKLKALASACSILVLAGALWGGAGWAQTTEEYEGPIAPDFNVPQDAPDVGALEVAPDIGATGDAPAFSAGGSQGGGKRDRQRMRASREANRRERLERIRLAKEAAAQKNEAVPAAFPRRGRPTGKANLAGGEVGSESIAGSPAVSLPSVLIGKADVGGRQEGSVSAPIVAPVPHAVVSLSGIEVSFKLDPRIAKEMLVGEGWVSAPISLHARAQDATPPSVEARADVLDGKGQPMEVSAEWTPADPEMVTVSPGQGNDAIITVRHAGQSSLKVGSHKLYKLLSIMAWYQDGGLQVEISQRP